MGKRGPKPMPTSLKLLRGSRQPISGAEPRPEVVLPRCPAHLRGEARKAWTKVGKQLEACGVMTALDAVGLEMLATAYCGFCPRE